METFYYALKDHANKVEVVFLDNLKRRLKKFSGFVAPTKVSGKPKYTY